LLLKGESLLYISMARKPYETRCLESSKESSITRSSVHLQGKYTETCAQYTDMFQLPRSISTTYFPTYTTPTLSPSRILLGNGETLWEEYFDLGS
jgi:hypothetical protein